MMNTDIKYITSKDYEKLHSLLKKGFVLVGFISVNFEGVVSSKYSKLVTMRYDEKHKFFDLGFTLFEQDFDLDSFVRICKAENVRYIPLK